MAEIKCPHCGKVFQVDETGYAQIVSQVRDQEFARALEERLHAAHEGFDKDLALEVERVRSASNREISDRDAQIDQLKAQVATLVAEQDAAVRDARAEAERQVVELKGKVSLLKSKAESREREFETARDLAVAQATGELSRKLTQLEGQAARDAAEHSHQLELAQAESAAAQARLVSEREQAEKALQDQMTSRLALKDEQIRELGEELERVRDQKSRLSTKMLGETLEQHCEIEFNKVRAMAFPKASFEKDTVAVSEGEGDRPTKGDYIFRELDDAGNEVLSIMFEMKTEQEGGIGHRTNASHLKKLDADRRKKGCEYAVLVSTLEPDNDLYNQGIVEAWEHEKMYVIRPQFFIPLIGLLRNAAQNSLAYKAELAEMRRQNIDVTNFEAKMDRFKEGFRRDVESAGKNFDSAIKEIDAAIERLEKVKRALTNSERYLGQAEKKVDDQLTIRKLSYRNPTMKALFDQAREDALASALEAAENPDLGDPATAEEPDRVE